MTSNSLPLNQSSVALGQPSNTKIRLQPIDTSLTNSPTKFTANQSSVFSPYKTRRQNKVIDPAYKLADFFKTLQTFGKQSYARKLDADGGGGEYQNFKVCGDDNQAIKGYGLGMYLYLEFVKRLFLTVFIMSAIMALPALIYYEGTALKNYTPSFTLTMAKFSLGNLKDSKRLQYIISTACDICATLVLLFFTFHWKAFVDEAVSSTQKDITVLNPSVYALSVVGFPSEVPNLEAKLVNYFNTVFNGCYQVEVVYDYQGQFHLFVEYNQLIEKIQKEKQIIKQINKDPQDLIELEQQLEKMEAQLVRATFSHKPLQAIIHFSTLKSKFNFINFCRRYGFLSSVLCDIDCCRDHPNPNQLFMNRYPLYIQSSALSRPEQINWPAADQTGCSQFWRRLVAILFLIIAIAISSSLIAICTLYVSSISSCESFDITTTLSVANAAKGQTLYCYCSAHLTEIYTVTAIKQACSNLSASIITTNAMQVAASVVSSITNILLMVVVQVLASKLLKPMTKPVQYSFVFMAVLISGYINSTLLPLIMNGNIFSFKSVTYLSFMSFIDLRNLPIFSDFSSDWYATISPYYLNMIIIQSIMPLISLLVAWIGYSLRKRQIEKACEANQQSKNDDPMIQSEADKIITSFSFDLPVEQATICLQLFIVSMYYTLIPLMLPIFAIGLALTALCKRTIIYKFSVRVPQNENISLKTAKLLPAFILIHCLMGLWAHTSPLLFTQRLKQLDNLSKIAIFRNDVDRVFSDIPMLGLAGLAAAWLVLDWGLLSLLSWFRESCFKNQLEIPLEFVAVEKVTYSSRLAKTNILGSYKLVNNLVYGQSIRAYKELMTQQNGDQENK